MNRHAILLALTLAAGPAAALTIDLPAPGKVTAREAGPSADYPLPVAAWHDGALRTRQVAGAMTRTAYRMGATDLTTAQLIANLRHQLQDAGYEVLFDCADRACGGYDFRFATEVLPAPAMQVDLGNFRYLAAALPDGSEAVGLLVSRAARNAYVQVTAIAPPAPGGEGRLVTATKSSEDPLTLAGPLAQEFERQGRAPLDDLSFETGAATLGSGDYGSLAELATYLGQNPAADVVLVGHTDAEGSLPANIALSRQRAASVRQRLIDGYGISADRLEAEGVGYLAPRAANSTPDGRLANRRVEAVLATP